MSLRIKITGIRLVRIRTEANFSSLRQSGGTNPWRHFRDIGGCTCGSGGGSGGDRRRGAVTAKVPLARTHVQQNKNYYYSFNFNHAS